MLGFSDKKPGIFPSKSVLRARDISPDSVIIAQETNFSLFSWASASVDRCSFGSDFQDDDSLFSDISKHLAVCDLQDCCSRGPDLELNRNAVQKSSSRKEKAKEEDSDHSLKYSFSAALKECQDRRLRNETAEGVGEGEEPVRACGWRKKQGRRRPVFLDLNNNHGDVFNGSPIFGTMTLHQKISGSRKSGTFPSPGTPSLRQEYPAQKGWSSERVPLPANGSRRYVNMLPGQSFNGRSLPSKWEDAEKWIFSPVTGNAINKPIIPPRRPKSKSGPLAGPGEPYSSSSMHPYNVGRAINLTPSPFLTTVPVAETCSVHVGSSHTEPCIIRSASVHGWSDLIQSALPGSQEGRMDCTKDASTMISPAVSRRDMATQMSPEGSTVSSPKEREERERERERERASFSQSPSSFQLPVPGAELQQQQDRHHLSRLEIRDVQVDERIAMTKRSKKQAAKGSSSVDVGEWRKKVVEARASAWEVAETAKCISKFKREESKITAWENLQKAKAEAEVRKLEMKLERTRSSSMDKIMNKLRSAQRKAQEMRISVSAGQANQVAKTANKAASFRKTGQIGSLSGCFTCHAS